MIAAQQISSVVAPSSAQVELDECLSEPWTDLEALRAICAAVPAEQRAQVLAYLRDCCARSDA